MLVAGAVAPGWDAEAAPGVLAATAGALERAGLVAAPAGFGDEAAVPAGVVAAVEVVVPVVTPLTLATFVLPLLACAPDVTSVELPGLHPETNKTAAIPISGSEAFRSHR